MKRGFGLTPRAFTDLAGWNETDHAAAWASLHAGAAALRDGTLSLRPAVAADAALRGLCALAGATPPNLGHTAARQFFEQHFVPHAISRADARKGFLTGYYEPVVEGSPIRTATFTAPILPRPDDLVTFAAGERHPAMPEGFSAGCRDAAGVMRPYPDRNALEAFAISPDAAPIVWLRDWTEVFLIHVQGSARVHFPDGSEHRLVYAGRNGHPYVSIGRTLIERGIIAEADMTLDRLKDWLRANGEAPGQPARALMGENGSYIFFRREPLTRPVSGPIGGAGSPLHPGASIAVDRTLWSYGLPFWITSDRAVPGFGDRPLARLFIAQDTGSAIVGPARADLFVGSGEAAGVNAGLIRHAADFCVLLPR